MTVSIIIVTYRTGPVLFRCLESVLSQEGVSGVAVVDNGNPPAVVARLRDLARRHEHLELLSGHGNVGFSRGCNLGASRVSSEYVMFVNPDCVLPADAVENLAREASELPEPFLLAPRLANPDGTEQRGGRREVLTPWRALVEVTRLYKLAPNHPYFRSLNQHHTPLGDTTMKVDVATGACMFMSLHTFQQLGGFDSKYFLYVEDSDLCVTLLRMGGSSYICPSVSVMHYGQTSQASRVFKEWNKCRGFCYYFRKHFQGLYPPGFLWLVNTAVIARFVAMLPALLVSDLLKRKNLIVTGTAKQSSTS